MFATRIILFNYILQQYVPHIVKFHYWCYVELVDLHDNWIFLMFNQISGQDQPIWGMLTLYPLQGWPTIVPVDLHVGPDSDIIMGFKEPIENYGSLKEGFKWVG